MNLSMKPYKTALFLRQIITVCAIGIALVPTLTRAASDAPSVTLSEGWRFVQQDGESLYRASCQGCHMAKGEGASGAGHFPPLANNPRLASPVYPAYTVLHGRDGMPSFGKYMSDTQIAEVVNYTRTHLGNQYNDPISAEEVKKLR
ncbi:cytochrome c [Glaciimonas sp. PCH181]|uniref:c-type cytochrome n=1 Tax=Glaciimonas sp. PCH181 TaxID=2133943 RepID=UPI000D3DB80C|nr:cytochrome c [Glaciimonas sp. PCH181]PUA19658.1 cytochrome C6 [Glaciimonas sp. PCH181]